MYFKAWLESVEDDEHILLPNFKPEERKKALQFQKAMQSGENVDQYFDSEDNLDLTIQNGLKYERQIKNVYNQDIMGKTLVLPGEDMYAIMDLIKLGQEIKKDKNYKELLDYLVDNMGAKKFVTHLLNQENLGRDYNNQLSGNSPASARVLESIENLASNNSKLSIFIGNIKDIDNFLKRMLDHDVIDEKRLNEIL